MATGLSTSPWALGSISTQLLAGSHMSCPLSTSIMPLVLLLGCPAFPSPLPYLVTLFSLWVLAWPSLCSKSSLTLPLHLHPQALVRDQPCSPTLYCSPNTQFFVPLELETRTKSSSQLDPKPWPKPGTESVLNINLLDCPKPGSPQPRGDRIRSLLTEAGWLPSLGAHLSAPTRSP